MIESNDVKSTFHCDACPRPAIFYSNSGPFKVSYRCSKHKPSTIPVINTEKHGRDKHPSSLEGYAGHCKYWVASPKGISLTMQKRVDERYKNKDI